MKILTIGDTHGDSQSIINHAIPIANKHFIRLIIQVGDFGYWEHTLEGARFLDKVSKHLVRNGIQLWFLDGNHDNHPLLWSKYPIGDDGFAEIRPNLKYIPRGTIFKVGHVTALAVGGAYSIDKMWRIKEEMIRSSGYGSYQRRDGFDTREDLWDAMEKWATDENVTHTMWWPTEMITDAQVYSTQDKIREYDGPIDIMFTHDAPKGVDVPGIHATDKWKFPETWENRERLLEIFTVAQPRILIHGHYHTEYIGGMSLKAVEKDGVLDWPVCRVDGLSNDGRPGFAKVLDLDALFPVS